MEEEIDVVKTIPLLLCLLLLLAGCWSSGSLSLVARDTVDPGSILKGRAYQVIGPAEGRACRFFLLGLIPFGDSTFATAVEEALDETGGDALVNVTTTSSLYGFFPIYNVLGFTCTSVKGFAVRLP